MPCASAGAAAAAECAASPGLPDTVVAPDNGSATVFPDGFIVSGGSADTCTVTNLAVPIPAGHYGVYKVDGRGFTAQNAGEILGLDRAARARAGAWPPPPL